MASTEDISLLLERAGLKLPQEEIQRLMPFFEQYLERLTVLREADLEEEEVAGIFTPGSTHGEGGAS